MKSFDELYLLYYKDVFRFLFKLCGYNQDIAEELTQETFFHAYLGITKFRTECNVKTWLFQIAKNRYIAVYLIVFFCAKANANQINKVLNEKNIK